MRADFLCGRVPVGGFVARAPGGQAVGFVLQVCRGMEGERKGWMSVSGRGVVSINVRVITERERERRMRFLMASNKYHTLPSFPPSFPSPSSLPPYLPMANKFQ